jgi:hypothetical protein
MNNVILITFISGAAIILAGLVMRKYPKSGWYLNLKEKSIISIILDSKVYKDIFKYFDKRKNGFIYKSSKLILDYSEADISMNKLIFYKIVCFIVAIICILAVRNTNLNAIKENIIGNPAQKFTIFQSKEEASDYRYNTQLYNTVVNSIGHERIKKLNKTELQEVIKKILTDLLNTSNKEVIETRTSIIIDTINRVNAVKLINWKVALLILLTFWIPEMLLLIRRIFLASLYRKEVIRLENIFELLGNIPEIKTTQIIEEMRDSTKAYKKHLNRCLEEYSQDKNMALDTLKNSVKNKRFSNLVMALKVFAMVDRKTAINILSRNKKEKEEDSLLLSEEDVEISDVIALISIVPIIYEIMVLMLKPMIDMSFDAFKLLGY